jgi:hypothetical protein
VKIFLKKQHQICCLKEDISLDTRLTHELQTEMSSNITFKPNVGVLSMEEDVQDVNRAAGWLDATERSSYHLAAALPKRGPCSTLRQRTLSALHGATGVSRDLSTVIAQAEGQSEDRGLGELSVAATKLRTEAAAFSAYRSMWAADTSAPGLTKANRDNILKLMDASLHSLNEALTSLANQGHYMDQRGSNFIEVDPRVGG